MRLEICLAALVASGAGAGATEPGAGAAEPSAAQEAERALSVARELEQLAGQRALWPGFDPLLESAIGADGPGRDGPGRERPCGIAPRAIAKVERTAESDAAAVRTARGERRKEFEARPGWRVVVQAAEGQPLGPLE